jgi:ABC-type glycerol-3-phosphate transport system substrate-binding protein
VPGYAEARAVLPLDEFSSPERLDLSRYAPAIRELLTHEGRHWAGVNTCYTLGLYHNRAMLRKAGWPEPPRTISELDRAADALTRRTPQGRIERAGFLQNMPGWWPYFWVFMFGGQLYDPIADKATIADPPCLRAFEWIRQCAARLSPAATASFAAAFGHSYHQAQDPFMTGRIAMIVQGPWLANFIRTYHPELDYACAPVPVADELYNPDQPAGMLEADVLMIPRGCPHPQEAYEFLCFTQRQDVQEELATAHCKPSPLLAVSPGFMERHPNPGVRVHDAIAKSSAVQVLPRTRAWKQYSDLTTAAFDAIWAGADPAAELGRVQARAQELIDTAAARRRQRGGAA